jgi:GT2 family glycosyltransferase
MLSVIILNWNAREWLERSIGAALAQETGGWPFEVVLVDNASTDGSVDFARERFPDLRILALSENLGFAGGNNAAIRQTAGEYVMLLNPDTQAHPGAFAAMLDFMASHPRCGILGPKVVNPDGSLQYSCRRFATLEAGFFRNTPLGKLFPGAKSARDYLMKDVPHDKAMPVDWVSGAAMVIRRALLDEIGLLDEEYFMYTEDVDLCYRAHAAGWEVWYDPAGEITHAIGQSSDKNSWAMIRAFHLSTWRFFNKHYFGRRYSPALKPLVAAGLVVRAALVTALNAWHRTRRKFSASRGAAGSVDAARSRGAGTDRGAE